MEIKQERSRYCYDGDIVRGDMFIVLPVPGTQDPHLKHGRPGVVISNNIINKSLSVVFAFSTTQMNKSYLPTKTVINCVGDTSYEQALISADDVMTVNRERIGRYIGHLSEEDMDRVDYSIMNSFDLERLIGNMNINTLCSMINSTGSEIIEKGINKVREIIAVIQRLNKITEVVNDLSDDSSICLVGNVTTELDGIIEESQLAVLNEMVREQITIQKSLEEDNLKELLREPATPKEVKVGSLSVKQNNDPPAVQLTLPLHMEISSKPKKKPAQPKKQMKKAVYMTATVKEKITTMYDNDCGVLEISAMTGVDTVRITKFLVKSGYSVGTSSKKVTQKPAVSESDKTDIITSKLAEKTK